MSHPCSSSRRAGTSGTVQNQRSNRTNQSTQNGRTEKVIEQRIIFGDPGVKEIKETTMGLSCILCKRSTANPAQLGMLLRLDKVIVHHYCLLFSSNLVQRGDEDSGIFGFLIKDILLEVERGRKLRCKYCNISGATIGCNNRKCRTGFHYPCGLFAGVQYKFMDVFPALCLNHREYQEIPLEIEAFEKSCPICMDEINITRKADYLLFPCCGHKNRTLFHKLCVMEQGYNAGYTFFKCPLCGIADDGIKNKFKELGVHIPEQDAAWERTDNYSDHLTLYRHCDMIPCNCPNGRDFEGKLTSLSNRPNRRKVINWTIVRCKTCGSKGAHVSCLSVQAVKFPSRWECEDCENVGREPIENVPEAQPNVEIAVEVDANANCNSRESQLDVIQASILTPPIERSVNERAQPNEESVEIAPVEVDANSVDANCSGRKSQLDVIQASILTPPLERSVNEGEIEIEISSPSTSSSSLPLPSVIVESQSKLICPPSAVIYLDSSCESGDEIEILEVKIDYSKTSATSDYIRDNTPKFSRFHEITEANKKGISISEVQKNKNKRRLPLGSSRIQLKRMCNNK